MSPRHHRALELVAWLRAGERGPQQRWTPDNSDAPPLTGQVRPPVVQSVHRGVIIDPESDHGELDLAVPGRGRRICEAQTETASAPSVPSVCQMPELHCWMFLQRHGGEVKSDQVQFSLVARHDSQAEAEGCSEMLLLQRLYGTIPDFL